MDRVWWGVVVLQKRGRRARSCKNLFFASREILSYTELVVEMPAIIRNHAGIHCRPSACIVKAVANYPGTITVVAPDGDCDPRSIMGLIALCLEAGTQISVRVEGPDEEDQCKRLVELFETEYDFPQRNLGQDTQVILSDLGVNMRRQKG
ncbi:MAG: HPr family phosphocarrier protein [Kiritimatiellae bacterium]|nr:HPr family phosphocarrier protein [Kiritimatiellia bacterium]